MEWNPGAWPTKKEKVLATIHVAGVDPGIVHTGCVSMWMDNALRQVGVEYLRVDGIDVDRVKDWIPSRSTVFIEKYVPHLKYGTDEVMVQGEQKLKDAFPDATLIRPTGSRQVVQPRLLSKLNLWQFPTSHHQDLRSAARIMLYGMMKDDDLNRWLADFIRDELNGKMWSVVRREQP